MFSITRHLAFGVVVLAVAGSAVAGTQTRSTHHKQSAKSTTSSPAKPVTPTTSAATGKIVQFDPATQSLTLATSKGEERFTLEGPVDTRRSTITVDSPSLQSTQKIVLIESRARAMIRVGRMPR